MKGNSLSAKDALEILRTDSAKCIDVRAPGEFSLGSIPTFANFPILSDQERHQVGICYKQNGSELAVNLGHQLVAGHRLRLVEEWRAYLDGARWQLVACWRGGMRSQIACEWLQEIGVKPWKVEGGYKQMRRELMRSFEALPDMVIIAGPTGSGKTKLLQSISRPFIDLESIACHRGSAFGQTLGEQQPAQANFENRIAFQLLKKSREYLFLEDESQMVGKLRLPMALKAKMNSAPIIYIQMDLEARVQNIVEEYILQPLARGIESSLLRAQYEESLQRISKKLGNQLATKILGRISLAFTSGNKELHKEWIRDLLKNYYDKAYAYSFERTPRTILFSGDWNECKNCIQEKFA